MRSKRGQGTMDLPFTWIFAILLIIVFIMVGVYGIKYFLNLSTCSNIGLSYDQLQKEIDQVYQSSSSEKNVEISFPGLTMICFGNLSREIKGSSDVYDQLMIYKGLDLNTFLLPPGKSCNMETKKLKHIDLDNTTSLENPHCIEIVDDKATLRLKKDYYSKAVTIK
jgi:hypothetical protein